MRPSILLLLIIITSCSTRHANNNNGSSSVGASASTIKKAMKNHNYVSLQSGPNFYYVTFAEIDKTKKNITVTLDKIDSIHHQQILTSVPNKNLQPDKPLIPQLHIIMVDSTYYTYDEPHTIALSKISSLQKL